jgi:hypothetical protein
MSLVVSDLLRMEDGEDQNEAQKRIRQVLLPLITFPKGSVKISQ